MAPRAVLYARVSYDDRDTEGRNLAGQLDMGREFAIRRGWAVIAELAEDDRGASGAAFELEQLDRIREMARTGQFDILVVREIDRLSRSLAKQLIVEEELKRAGVSIEYVLGEYPNTPEGNLMKNVRASVAEYERLKINERMVRGRRNKVKVGNVLAHGRPPYGYRLGEVDGRSVMIVQEEEARIVRLIFQWISKGDERGNRLSTKLIAKRLTDMQVLTWGDIHRPGMRKRGSPGHWYASTVAKIIRSETYMGTWYYGQRNNFTHKDNPRDYWLAVEVPALVDEVTWKKAQEGIEVNKKAAKRDLTQEYLLRGRVKCGRCGYSMHGRFLTHPGRTYRYYNCNSDSSRTALGRCGIPSFRAEPVDEAVWNWIKSFLADRVGLRNGLYAYQQEREHNNLPLRERLKVVESLVAENQTQLDRLLDLYLSGDFPKEMLIERKARLETTIQALKTEHSGLIAHLEARTLTDEEIRGVEEFAAEIAEGLDAAEESFVAKRRIIEKLNVQVTLSIEEGQRVVYARCMLGADVLSVEDSTTRN